MKKEKTESWKHEKKSDATKAKISESMRGNGNARNKRKPDDQRCAAAPISFPGHVWRALESRLAKTGEMRSRFVANAVAIALGLPPIPTARKKEMAAARRRQKTGE